MPHFQASIYRDDGIRITNFPLGQTEKLRQAIIRVCNDHNLKITIEVGLTKVNFLDVTLDLSEGTYRPYRKPGDKPLYVDSWSNHPPRVLQNIPTGINRRLCEISSNKEVFLEAIPPYQLELDRCGYTHKLEWMEQEPQPKKCRSRSRKVLWFNPPYSIKTNKCRKRIFIPFRQTLPQGPPPQQNTQSQHDQDKLQVSTKHGE